MNNPTPKNLSASVHQRLLNIARDTGTPFNEILQYFAIERMLHRLSCSSYAASFVLKGALLFRVWDVPDSRATRDIDLLAYVDNSAGSLASIFRDVVAIDESDGLVFDPDSVAAQTIKEGAEYEGVRIRFRGSLGKARITLQIDVGFGDKVHPDVVQADQWRMACRRPLERLVKRIPKTITKNETRLLTGFLEGQKRPTGTLRFHELQGFLFTIASSPETIPTSEWLPQISDDEDIGFANEDEAHQILNGIMALYNDVNTSVLERSQNLPHGCSFTNDLDTNFNEGSSIGQWSRGFLVGHNWLVEVWEEYLIEEMEEECGATMMVLSFFSSRQLAEAYYDDGKRTRKNPDKSFEDFANTMRDLFPSAMASYAHMGRTIFEVLLENTDDAEPRH